LRPIECQRMMKHVQTFAAKDSDGREYIIDEYANATSPKVAVSRKLLLRDGRNVTRVGKGRYTILDGAVILTSDDPKAP
jgi:hypothetical protein